MICLSIAAALALPACAQQHEDEAAPTPVVAVKVVRAQLEDVQIAVRAPATIFPRR